MRLSTGILIIFSFMTSFELWSQDERYFRELFLKKYHEDEVGETKKNYSYTVPTPFYTIDVNFDGKNESFVYSKKESEDWIDIFDHEKKAVFKYRFDSVGAKSRLYKIRFTNIDENVGLAIFYFYEGVVNYHELDSSARLYFLTFKRADFSNFKMVQGPYLFQEFKGMKGHYHQRIKQVEVIDLNNDQRKEIIIKHHLYSIVYRIKDDGSFEQFRNKM